MNEHKGRGLPLSFLSPEAVELIRLSKLVERLMLNRAKAELHLKSQELDKAFKKDRG